jgi:uncharacterized membrane protein
MAEKTGSLVAAVYTSEDRASVMLDTIQQMHNATTITIIDAAAINKDADGKVHIKETKELTTGKGARRGALVTGLVGLVFPPSLIASVVVGGGIGALMGKLKDSGIKHDSMKEIANQIGDGQSAVVVLAEDAWVPQIEQALKGNEAKLIVQPIDDETLKQLYLAQQAEQAPS